uniref:hypothetical protein n=1 Tax=Natrinema thermotolerans TaxID=121872 RepID=UPI000679DBD7
IERLRDDRSADEIRRSVCDRVGTEPIPSRLSRETIIESIARLARSGVARETASTMNERQLRIWLADLCGFGFDPAADRGLNYRREELQQIDQALEEHIDGGIHR